MRKIVLFPLCLLLLHSSLVSKSTVNAQKEPKAISGVLNLQQWNFMSDGCLPLQGEWEFYWNQLISPDNIDNYTGAVSKRKFDLLWNNASTNESAFDETGYATYRLKVKLNQNNIPRLALSIPDFYSAYTLFLNGRVVASNGIVGKSKDTSTPQWLPMTINLPKVAAELDLVLHISNFRHSKGGASKNILLGESNQVAKLHYRDFALDLLLTGCLLMTAFFFFGLYWFGKQDLQVLFFALYSLMYSYRIFGFGIYTFHTLFPEIPWIITLRLEYITLFLSSLFFACYTRELYKKETSKIFVQAGSILSFIFSCITLLFPPLIFTQLVGPYFIILLLGFIYIIYTYVLAVYNKRTGSILSLIGTSIVLIVFGYNILVYFGFAEEMKVVTSTGYFIFFFIQSIILFNLHTDRINSAKIRAETISKSKSEFLSTISHEMRTPLNAVIGLSNYLINDNPKKNHVADLKSLKHSADNLNFLINDVLDFSKIEAGQIVFDYTDVNLHELIQNQIKSLKPRADEKGIELTSQLNSEIPKMIVCDGFRLNQVLTNLLGNAIKFTKQGAVQLIIEKVAETNETVSIKFTVEDTGIGIPKESYETIFDNYIQASASITKDFGGTGLGLAITKKILTLQNTDIHVSSKIGIGSKFYFTQKFKVCEIQEPPEDEAYEEMPGFEGKIILLVEDNPVNVMIETKFLARWNIAVDVASNGEEAIEKAKAKKYDLILMDLRMPVMDGYQATEKLREIGIEIPIIAVTASGISNVGEKLFKSGMNDFIKKPFNPDEMYSKVKKYLSSHSFKVQ